MKKNQLTLLILMISFIANNVLGQANPTVAVQPSNAGIVGVGSIIDLTINIGNTLAGNIAISKLRPIITVPASVVFLTNAMQLSGLPTGWAILSNTGTQLRLCNNADIIPGNVTRTITLKVRGVTINSAQTFSGQINFGNGTTCAAGPTVSGNNIADDFATSTIQVIAAVVPLTLTDFSASINNCKPNLKWSTESEINTDRFEIERSDANGNDFKFVATVAANGYSSSKIDYNFIDKNFNIFSEKVFYRLKMIDIDGKYKYSNILPVQGNCKVQNVFVYPNPVQEDKLFISTIGIVGNINATLFSVTGQTIKKFVIGSGTNFINVANIANGIYVLNIITDNGINKNINVTISK